MLVILVVVEITTVLLDTRINTKLAGIHFLNPQIVCLQLAINLAMLLAISSIDPNTLDVASAHDMIPMRVRSTGVFLGGGEEAEVLDGLGEVARKVVPELLGLVAHGLQALFQSMEGFGEDSVVVFRRLL